MNTPRLFDLDEDTGHAVARSVDVGPDLEEQAHSAVGSCPERAISLTN